MGLGTGLLWSEPPLPGSSCAEAKRPAPPDQCLFSQAAGANQSLPELSLQLPGQMVEKSLDKLGILHIILEDRPWKQDFLAKNIEEPFKMPNRKRQHGLLLPRELQGQPSTTTQLTTLPNSVSWRLPPAFRNDPGLHRLARLHPQILSIPSP